MIEKLKKYCSEIVDFTSSELDELGNYFSQNSVNKKEFLLENGQVCNFIGFLTQGCMRHFHIKDGEEITCDISLEESFVTEFNSFNSGSKAKVAIQALEDSILFVINKKELTELYQMNPKFEQLGRKIAERVAMRNSDIAMSLASEKPEKRYANLLREKPEIFQRVQQKYIANILGIKPESLSRLQKRVFEKRKS